MQKLKIAVYYPWIYLKGGIERSMAALISNSGHDWTIFTSYYDQASTFEEFANFKIVNLENVTVQRDMGSVLKAAVSICTMRLPLDDFDAYVVWCDGLGTLTTFRNSKIPTFCICSTPLRPVYDPVYAKHALLSRKFLARTAYHCFKNAFRHIDRLAWSRFDGVVATSLEVKERIVENRLYPDDQRMVLRYPGIFYSDAPENVTYQPFFLIPGRVSWTKNIQLGVDAFLKADLPPPWRLVIAGFVDNKSKSHIAELRARAKGDARIEFIECPTDAQLNELYRTTSAVMFTPLNEDWGIVPLEAMLNGKPVIANNQGGPAESVLAGETGWLLRPNNVAAWADVLRRIAQRPEIAQTFGARAKEHVRQYDWSQFCTGVDDMLVRSVSEQRRVKQSVMVLAQG